VINQYQQYYNLSLIGDKIKNLGKNENLPKFIEIFEIYMNKLRSTVNDEEYFYRFKKS
jgi:hypothetical protein